MRRVKKVFNNNVVLCVDNNQQEAVIMGKGIGYHKFPEDSIDDCKIEKIFLFQDGKSVSVFDKLANEIPLEHIELASEIVQKGKEELTYQLNDGILITLADHLSYLLQRMKAGEVYLNPLHWEIKSIYPEEYEYSRKAVSYLREKTNYDIPDTEASFIAMHFVNAHIEMSNMEETLLTTKIIDGVLDIVRYYYNVEVNESSLDYSRFISHLRYFVKRQLQGECLEDNTALLSVIKVKCPKDYACATRIKKYLETTYAWIISEDELLYLTLHLNRIMLKHK